MTGSISTASTCLAPCGEGDGDVVAVAGADHEDPVGRTVEVAVREGVEGLEVEQLVDPIRRLVRDVVGRDRERVVRLDASHLFGGRPHGGDLVVRRPVVVGRGGLDPEHDDEHDEPEQLRPEAEQHGEEHRDDRSPHDRRELQEGQRREHDDAAGAAEDVEAVRLQGLELHEHARHAVADAGHHGDSEEEDHREADPPRQRGHAERALQLSRQVGQVHREDGDEEHQQPERHGRERQEVGSAVDPEEPDADPEEAGEQDEVRQVGEVDVVGGRPADQRQLDEQHEEAEPDQA